MLIDAEIQFFHRQRNMIYQGLLFAIFEGGFSSTDRVLASGNILIFFLETLSDGAFQF